MSMEGHLQSAMKAVGKAIKLDGDGNSREAYFRYLACIQYISQVLLQEAKNQGYQGSVKTKSTERMVKLAQQCMDRTSAIMEVTAYGQTDQLSPPPVAQSGRFSPSITFNSSPPPVPKTVEQQPKPAQAYKPPSAFGLVPQHTEYSSLRAGQGTATSLPVPMGYKRPVTRNDKLTPLEAAYLENRRLMSAYQARLLKLMETSRGRGKQNKTNLNLALQRRLMENMAIARAREAALAKKIHERHQRLQEEAARRFSSTGEPTKMEIELRQIYASVMEFENNESWLLEWREKLREAPKDLKFIHSLISHILACQDHPFTQLLKKFQFSVYQSLLPLIQKDAEALEQIRVPYKMVEPLAMSDSKPRVIPTDSFAAPEDLDESLDEDLMRRLKALRTSSHIDQRESLYGNMLASSSSQDKEEEEGDLWDELNSGDETLEDGIKEETRKGDGEEEAPSNHSETTSVKSVGDSGDEKEILKTRLPSNEELTEGGEGDAATHDSPLRSREPSVGESGEETDVIQNNLQSDEEQRDLECDIEKSREPSRSSENLEEEDGEDVFVETDVVHRMRSISLEIQDDLADALTEGDKLTKILKDQVAEDSAVAEGNMNGNIEETNGINSGDESDVAPDLRTEDVCDDDSETAGKQNVSSEGVPEDTLDHNLKSNSIQDTDTCLDSDDQSHDCSTHGEDAVREDQVSKDADLSSRVDERTEERQETKKTEEEEAEERIARLQEEALQRHLKHISKDIQNYLDKLQSLLIAVYEELDSALAKEQCIAVIEKHFFHYIWQPLLTLFRRSNLRKEMAAATAMTKYQNALPENIGIIGKLCLTTEGAVQDENSYPYQLAVEELRRISGYFSPLDKLECVVKASRAIITCVGDFYEAQGQARENAENAVGCDDLLPILSFVVIKSALPHIVSECSVMEEFIHEGYLFGEEGYCLTTLQTSLGYVLKLAED
ncbi:VPS9 domain-containing protein 1-like [Asterias rubens]|uniref:VPS9 domain-containing protein 1-like n=1 Tax=Asterias rubens TaxID=7604 RepID=UPI0014556478|nr:VPS9 domain-containing protein 1-like [Asterias rubens]